MPDSYSATSLEQLNNPVVIVESTDSEFTICFSII